MMKKLALVALTLCLLLLAACRVADPAESVTPTPDPTPSQTVESPTPETTPQVTPEPSALPTGEPTVFPQFLTDFSFPRADALVTGGSSMQYITCYLTDGELAQLKEALAMDTWWAATDVPAMGLDSNYTLTDEEGRSLIIAEWDETKCLILAKEDSESHLYYASPAVLEAFEGFLADKNFLPDFVRYFGMDQVEIDRTPLEQGEGYKDHDVYLLDDTEQLSFLAALSPDTWTVATGDELGVMYADALTARDREGNQLILAPWDEEKCLVSCFFYDYSLYGPGAVVRYWAPASIVDQALTFVRSHAPLGTIDNEKLRYYQLLRGDPGFDLLLLDPTEDGSISEEQMAPYALTVLAFEGQMDYEIGVSPETLDEITMKHFGRKMLSYTTAWSKVLLSGNVTATGWDTTSSFYPVLEEITAVDQSGTITAIFRVYSLPEYLWIDEVLPYQILSHAREYLLSGNDKEFLEDERCTVDRVSITFRIGTEEVYGVQKEYVVYDAVRTME